MSRGTALSALTLMVFVTASACTGATLSETDEVALPDDDSKADGITELRVRAGETTLWIDKGVVRETRGDRGDLFVLNGRTSRDLVDGRGFVFDDVYGTWAQLTQRTFELTWSITEATSLLTGVQQFIGLTLLHSEDRPDNLTGRVIVRPRLGNIHGSSSVYLTAELTPVVSGGRTVLRMRGHGYESVYGVAVQIGDYVLSDVRRVDDTNFEADLLVDHVLAYAGTSAEIVVTVSTGSGAKVKRANLGLAVKRVGLTTEDPSVRWPSPTCTPEMQACLTALPAGTFDLSSCGEAVSVLACRGVVGATVDDVAITDALHTLDARLSDPAGFSGDAVGLVGPARATSFVEAVRLTGEEHIQNNYGRWYLTTDAIGAALSAEADGVVDAAYARPLDYVEPFAPDPADAQRMRDVAADGLLTYLAAQDFASTEYSRSLIDILRVERERALHVEAVRFLREEAVPNDWSPNPDWNNYVGQWLSSPIEVRVNRFTGEVAEVFFEID